VVTTQYMQIKQKMNKNNQFIVFSPSYHKG
jgi:hypothetical protein